MWNIFYTDLASLPFILSDQTFVYLPTGVYLVCQSRFMVQTPAWCGACLLAKISCCKHAGGKIPSHSTSGEVFPHVILGFLSLSFSLLAFQYTVWQPDNYVKRSTGVAYSNPRHSMSVSCQAQESMSDYNSPNKIIKERLKVLST